MTAPDVRPVGSITWPWIDGDPERTTDQKVSAALAAFRLRFGFDPAYVSTSCVDCPANTDVDGVPVRGKTWIAKGHFYLVRWTV